MHILSYAITQNTYVTISSQVIQICAVQSLHRANRSLQLEKASPQMSRVTKTSAVNTNFDSVLISSV